MTNHVAVLRRLRGLVANAADSLRDDPCALKQKIVEDLDDETDAFDHAIATCEQHAALVAERDDYRTAATWEAKRADEMQAKHAALVARLGELEERWRGLDYAGWWEDEAVSRCADALARVVAGNGGGDA